MNSHSDLDELREVLKKQDEDTLRCLYAEYTERARNRGAHIWSIAAIFVPLSISGVVALSSDNPCRTFAIAIASIAVIQTWVCMSDVLRNNLNRERTIRDLVEAAMLGEDFSLTDEKRELNKQFNLPPDGPSLRAIRRWIARTITAWWVIVIFGQVIVLLVRFLCSTMEWVKSLSP